MYIKKTFLFFLCVISVYCVDGMSLEGVSEFIEETVYRTGEYSSFKALLKTADINHEVCEEFRHLNGSTDKKQMMNNQKICFQINPHYGQTQQGFLLHINELPNELWTPWGAVYLTGLYQDKKDADDLFYKAFCQVFLKKFKISFSGGTKSERPFGGGTLKFYELVDQKIDLKELLVSNKNEFSENLYTVLSEEDMGEREGTETLIWGDGSVGTCYELLEVDGIEIPRLIMSEKNYRSYECVKFIWNFMENLNRRKKI